ncbi:glycosyl hydrolases family 31-domain-containing protein [Spinellus fusiger]|nr:glycosyl hydrolases family 31-domain-containing protein [Spinellus fusiger]
MKLPCISFILQAYTALGILLLLAEPVEAVNRENFKICSQSGFCRRHRAYADDVLAQPAFKSPYVLLKDSIQLGKDNLYAEVENTGTQVLLTLDISLLQDNTARVRINEKAPIKPRYEGHIQFTMPKQPVAATSYKMTTTDKGVITIVLEETATRKIVIVPEPMQIDFIVDGESVLSLNDRGLFQFEHLRTKESHVPRMVDQTEEDGTVKQVTAPSEEGLWEESFKSWTDPKPNGPESFGLDVSFHGFEHVYGIPEHASSLSLKETRGGEGAYEEPYRLYNTDVFEFETDSPASLYGGVPFMVAHRKDMSVGVFFMNPAETWIDIVKTKEQSKSSPQKGISTQTHWMTEAGVLDLFVFLGPTTKEVLRQYHTITGTMAMPQLFAIAYHQCRWNYINQKDVLEVDSQFDKNDMPYDVIWLDIEYTEEKKYFTWDTPKFSTPIKMEEDLEHKGRKLVVIIDPHIKRVDGYHIFEEAKSQGLFVQQPSGDDYKARCWPGESSWVDFSNPAAYAWWAKQYAFDKFKGTRENVFLWNDMNEPAVFDGPEMTMQKEMLHYGQWESRVLHNMYGALLQAATFTGLKERTTTPKRPFVLTRSFYAGSHRYGAAWTGDTMADWNHLSYTSPMILTNSLGGMPFTGGDIPGFFGNPTPELLTRWYQAGVFQPFVRAHAHIDTKRREPYLFDEPHRSIIRSTIRERYALLSYWYTLFFEAHTSGTPMMRPMFMEFPEDEALFTTQDQFMVGSSILVKPVTTEGAVTTDIYFAGDQPWYDITSYEKIQHHGTLVVDAPLHKIPAYYRGGSIVPRRERHRRSSASMALDPFTLIIAPDVKNQAQGALYLDDGETYDFERGAYAHVVFSYKDGVLSSKSIHKNSSEQMARDYAQSIEQVRVERIQLIGTRQPKQVYVSRKDRTKVPVSFEYHAITGYVTIKDPKVSVVEEGWEIIIE